MKSTINKIIKNFNLENFEGGEFEEYYECIENQDLALIFGYFHEEYNWLFRRMNEKLPTTSRTEHYWADESRKLLNLIEHTITLKTRLKNNILAFEIDEKYEEYIYNCRDFLKFSNGSSIPIGMDKIDIVNDRPIFTLVQMIEIKSFEHHNFYNLTEVGNGSYANVYKFTDSFYNITFALKKAKESLDEKELERFRREYEIMNGLSSPHIVEVYKYEDQRKQYIMEFLDYSLEDYLTENDELAFVDRKKIVLQMLKGFLHTEDKEILHRDISPGNILIKKYDSKIIVKISDFGLGKILDSTLTSKNTDFKGSFNDYRLLEDGMDTYSIVHETYALSYMIKYIMTMNRDRLHTETGNATLDNIIKRGMSYNYNDRFQSVLELFLEAEKL